MFYIDQTTPGFIKARDEHYANVRYVIKKKLLGKHFTEPHPKGLSKGIDQEMGIHSSVKNFFNDEDKLRDLLIGTPDILDKIKTTFKAKKTIDSVKKLIRYDTFIKKDDSSTFNFYHAYHLAENLDIQTCVYCNRLYAHTIITEKREMIARATFDHWFPKSSYPLLALSFYNLIPSCTVCNSSVKGATSIALKNIFHPYLKYTDPAKNLKFNFSYTLEDHVAAESSLVPHNTFSSASLDAMKLREMYAMHNDEIRELIYLKKAYSDGYLSSLKAILKTPLSAEEVYRLAFGVYLEDDQLIRRPLSKLKKDILDELGMLK